MFQKMPENILLSDSSLFSLSREDEDVYLTVNSKASLTVKEIFANTISVYELNISTGNLTVDKLFPISSSSSIGSEGEEYEYGYFVNLDVRNLTVTQSLSISGGIQDLNVGNQITTHLLSVDDIYANGTINGELNTFQNNNRTLPVGGLCFIDFTSVDYLERGEILYLYQLTASGHLWRLSRNNNVINNIAIGLCSIDGTDYDDPSSIHSVKPFGLEVGDRIQILSHGYKKTINNTTKFVPCLAIRLQKRIEEE